MSRLNTVTLLISGTEKLKEFEVTHAERILSTPKCGWELPGDSNFIFDNTNGLKLRANKGKVNKARK